jgi:predicted exporter
VKFFYKTHNPAQRNYTWLIVWAVTTLITLGVFLAQLQKGLPIVSDISYLLPATANAVEQEIIQRQNESFQRRYILLISSPEQNLTQQVHEALSQLAPDYGFQSALNQTLPEAYLALVQQYPYALLQDADKQALNAANSDYLTQSAMGYWLGFNAAGFLSPNQDPLALAGKFFQAMGSRLNGEAEGVLTPVAIDPQASVLWQQILPLSHTTADKSLDAQQLTFDALQQLISQIQKQYPNAQVAATGLAVHSVISAQQTQKEIFIISSIATIAIIALSLSVYRRVLPLFAACGTIVFGSWVGVVGCIALFQQIHILAIAFGTSLMGVVVDYSFHYFSVQRRLACGDAPANNKKLNIIRIIFPGISLSLITAVAGYLGLWQTGMLVLQQIALLCVLGILAACLTIVAIYPLLPQINMPAWHLPIERVLTRIALNWQRVPTLIIYALFATLLVFTGYTLYQARINPNLAALYMPPASLKATEKNIAQIYKEFVPNQYMAVLAADPQALVKHLYQLKPELQALISQGVIQSYKDLTQWVPDPARLAMDAEKYHALLQDPKIQAHFAQFDASVNPSLEPPPAQLTAEWINQLPEAIKNNLFVTLADGRVAGLIRFSAITNPAALHTALKSAAFNSPLQETLYIDTIHTIADGLKIQTQRASYGLALAFFLAFCILMAFYRNRTAIALIAVPLASCAITLCLISAFGSLSLFHLLALFLALGLGVDYAILFSHSGKFPEGVSAEIVSLAAVGNALSFGLLSFTSLPMLAAFGVATSVCLICNFIFAPLVVRWVQHS